MSTGYILLGLFIWLLLFLICCNVLLLKTMSINVKALQHSDNFAISKELDILSVLNCSGLVLIKSPTDCQNFETKQCLAALILKKNIEQEHCCSVNIFIIAGTYTEGLLSKLWNTIVFYVPLTPTKESVLKALRLDLVALY